MRLIPIQFVKQGSFLGKTLYDDQGRILLREGLPLTKKYLEKIKKNNIYSLYVIDKYSTTELEDIIKPELRQQAVDTVKNTFFSFEKYVSYSSKKDKTPQYSLLKKQQEYFDNINDIAKEIVEQILSKDSVVINLVDIKSMDNYTYQHCVNVAVLSLVIGIQMRLDKINLYHLCLGALLHDIGKISIPDSIIKKPSKLTDEEFEIIKQHTVKGYEYLKKNFDIPAAARLISLQHHEMEDGGGYPYNLKGDKISKLSKIVSVADVYDALTSDRPYRKAMCPNEALEYIMAYSSAQFDIDIVKVFTKTVVPYPPGTLIKLSTGDYAIVEQVNIESPMRPVIKIIKSIYYGLTGTVINMETALNIVIKEIVYEIPDDI